MQQSQCQTDASFVPWPWQVDRKVKLIPATGIVKLYAQATSSSSSSTSSGGGGASKVLAYPDFCATLVWLAGKMYGAGRSGSSSRKQRTKSSSSKSGSSSSKLADAEALQYLFAHHIVPIAQREGRSMLAQRERRRVAWGLTSHKVCPSATHHATFCDDSHTLAVVADVSWRWSCSSSACITRESAKGHS